MSLSPEDARIAELEATNAALIRRLVDCRAESGLAKKDAQLTALLQELNQANKDRAQAIEIANDATRQRDDAGLALEAKDAALAAMTQERDAALLRVVEANKPEELGDGTQIPIARSRLFDLVRFKRGELLDDGLITLDEWTWLVASDSYRPHSARRLEAYDGLIVEVQEAKARADAAEQSLAEVLAAPLGSGTVADHIEGLRTGVRLDQPVIDLPDRSPLRRELAETKAALAEVRGALDDKWQHALAKDASLRAYENQKTVAPLGVPQLLYAPIWTAVRDAVEAVLTPRRTEVGKHAVFCRAYGNYQPPYEDCTCGAEQEPR